MEGKIIDSFRLIFVDIDQSYNIPVADSASQGYMVVRAPKGTTEAMYFAKGSTNQIQAMLGIPTADWPDIQEALDLNGSYGLWISAPPGTSEAYPSYYGGIYVTKSGLYPFYQVTDKNAPNFRTLISVENEVGGYVHNDTLADAVVAPVYRDDAGNTLGQDYFRITGIPGEILGVADSIRFSFWGNSEATAYNTAATYELIFSNKDIMVEHPDGVTGLVKIGELINSDTEIKITGTVGETSWMYLDFEQIADSAAYKTLGVWTSPEAKAEYTAIIRGALVGDLQWVIDLTDETYMTISQKSPTEKETIVTFTDIGYDRYLYNMALDAFVDKPYWQTYEPGDISGEPYYPIAADVENSDGLYLQFFTSAYLVAHPTAKTGIWKSTGNSTPPTDVTSTYRGKYIRVVNAGFERDDTGDSGEIVGRDPDAAGYVDQIYYIDSTDTLRLCVAAPTGTQVALKPATNYNTLTFSVKEDVYPGDEKSGGTFTGSLSETGKDTYGGDIYFPNVLPDSAMSFIEVNVYKTFDADLNGAGFFTGTRIIDSRMYLTPSTAITGSSGYPALQGQRYITSVVNSLISSGTTGGVLHADFVPALTNGWTEAAKTTYESVYVFAEPTGEPLIKPTLYNLRTASHKLATFVSPKIITTAEALNPSTIIVSGRVTGTAQSVNRMLRRDTYTGKKYWSTLIGSYAAKLLRIIEGKLGGWAPMYTDVSGYGGQLPVTVERAEFEFTADQQQILDEKGLNPIILDPTYGVMVISQKTTQDPENLSDWSYLGHQMAFDLFKREVRDNVMLPQIGKPNDAYYQAMRQRQVEAILNRRINGPQPIWAAGKVEVANVNTPEVKAQRKFAIRVSVKVNVFSEWVELTFINTSQTMQL